MESFLTTISVLFFTFLVLAAAVEAIVEALRGVFEFIPTDKNPLRPRISLDDALKLSDEFAAGNTMLKAKVASVQKVVDQIGASAGDAKSLLTKALREQDPEEAAAQVTSAVADLKQTLDGKDRFKVLVLRTLSAIVGFVLVWWLKINLLDIMMAQTAPNPPEWLTRINGFFRNEWLSIIIGGLAASAGSSYWHDKLDQVRNLKSISGQVSALSQRNAPTGNAQ